MIIEGTIQIDFTKYFDNLWSDSEAAILDYRRIGFDVPKIGFLYLFVGSPEGVQPETIQITKMRITHPTGLLIFYQVTTDGELELSLHGLHLATNEDIRAALSLVGYLREGNSDLQKMAIVRDWMASGKTQEEYCKSDNAPTSVSSLRRWVKIYAPANSRG